MTGWWWSDKDKIVDKPEINNHGKLPLFQRPFDSHYNQIASCIKRLENHSHLSVYRVISTEREHTLFQGPSNIHNIQLRLPERKATPCVIRDYLLYHRACLNVLERRHKQVLTCLCLLGLCVPSQYINFLWLPIF